MNKKNGARSPRYFVYGTPVFCIRYPGILYTVPRYFVYGPKNNQTPRKPVYARLLSLFFKAQNSAVSIVDTVDTVAASPARLKRRGDALMKERKAYKIKLVETPHTTSTERSGQRDRARKAGKIPR
jgi:hypothetical protein